jgi:hypothetical protein
VPRAEHIAGDGTGSTGQDQKRAHESVQHILGVS